MPTFIDDVKVKVDTSRTLNLTKGLLTVQAHAILDNNKREAFIYLAIPCSTEHFNQLSKATTAKAKAEACVTIIHAVVGPDNYYPCNGIVNADSGHDAYHLLGIQADADSNYLNFRYWCKDSRGDADMQNEYLHAQDATTFDIEEISFS